MYEWMTFIHYFELPLSAGETFYVLYENTTLSPVCYTFSLKFFKHITWKEKKKYTHKYVLDYSI